MVKLIEVVCHYVITNVLQYFFYNKDLKFLIVYHSIFIITCLDFLNKCMLDNAVSDIGIWTDSNDEMKHYSCIL